jgi:alkylation response protein AidB-like acyl-CoA dehydrogenase
MFIVDLNAAGVTVRPLRQITGESQFNEVFLTDVHVGAEAVIGEVGRGWPVVKTWLTYEHRGVSNGDASRPDDEASAVSPISAAVPTDLIEPARKCGSIGNPAVQQLIVQTFIDDAVYAMLSGRLTSAMRAGELPEQAGSMLKISAATIDQRRAESMLTIVGPASVAWPPDDGDGWCARRFLLSQMFSIAGGTNEIHRNTLGDYVLGLPREPAPDRRVAFRDILRNSGK